MLLILDPEASEVLVENPASDTERLPNSSEVPLKLVDPILHSPFLTPSSAYSLIEAKEASLQLTAAVKPLMTWMRVCLKLAVSGVPHMGSLDL